MPPKRTTQPLSITTHNNGNTTALPSTATEALAYFPPQSQTPPPPSSQVGRIKELQQRANTDPLTATLASQMPPELSLPPSVHQLITDDSTILAHEHMTPLEKI